MDESWTNVDLAYHVVTSTRRLKAVQDDLLAFLFCIFADARHCDFKSTSKNMPSAYQRNVITFACNKLEKFLKRRIQGVKYLKEFRYTMD